MTEAEIIKALKCCTLDLHWGRCEDCPCELTDDKCLNLLEQAAELISRQKAEIEKLKETEAIREFAERLKEMASQTFWESDAYVGTEQIDILVKEMVGDTDEG